ncbi:MAG: 30S ribosome-binding factor RbfA [Candidatus Omnitrophica bacterium]|nr:30S ribosome-binding factor RbfA [Candidatus Omnitrophota bacterium]
MLQGKRNRKVALQVKSAVADAIVHEIRDPRVGFVTVTDADLSQDLKYATIYISVMGDEKQRKGTLIALNYAKGFFQRVIATELKLRFTPKVKFLLDDSIDEAMKIDSILKKIHSESDDERSERDTSADQG